MSLDWMDRAKCRHPSVTPSDFSPTDTRGHFLRNRAEKVAAEFCASCPVRLDCLRSAVAQGAQAVVRGGMWFPPRTSQTPAPELEDLLVTDGEPTNEGVAA